MTPVHSRERSGPKAKAGSWLTWAIGIILLLTLTLTVIAWLQAASQVGTTARHNFELAADEIAGELNDRVQTYMNTLYGLRGFFHASDVVSEKEFREYLASLDPAKNYPGLDSMYFVTRVPSGQLEKFVAWMQTQKPGFQVFSPSSHAEHFIVTYLGIHESAPGPGVDLSASDERRPIMERARDTGLPAASETLYLLDRSGRPRDTTGFLITMPVYKDASPDTVQLRRSELEGFVSAVFDYKSFLGDALQNGTQSSGLRISIADSAGALVYTHGEPVTGAQTKSIPLKVADKTWTMSIEGDPRLGLSQQQANAPLAVAIIGGILVGLLGLVLSMQYRARARAVALAEVMTNDLRVERDHAREAERRLEESNSRFEMIAQATSEVVHDLDLQTGALWWNGALTDQYGYRRQKAVNTMEWWIDHIHPDDAMKVNEEMDRLLDANHNTWVGSYRFQRADGSYADVYDRIFVVRNGRGMPVRLVGSMLDVTKEKELERAKDQFIAVASHQLRTPLGSIRWNLELLLEDKAVPAATRERAQEAYNSTLRMLGLVGDLLSVARIEQGRVHDMPAESDLVEIIGMAAAEMKPIANERKVTLKVPTKPKKLTAVIDPKRFREAIQNLLSNAVKYTPSGGTVTVDAYEKGDALEISVSDTGIGIPPKDQANLFTKFFRASNVTATDTEGNGLGLFVVKSYIEGWGGDVWLTSKLGKGTTFYMSVPRKAKPKKT